MSKILGQQPAPKKKQKDVKTTEPKKWIGDVDFGYIDARKEFIQASDRQNFLHSFQIPKHFRLVDFTGNGGKSFIKGVKGSGKTALLLYIKDKIDKTEGGNFFYTRIIRFQQDITADDRQGILGDSEQILTDFDSPDKKEGVEFDSRPKWMFYILKIVSNMIFHARKQSQVFNLSHNKAISDDLIRVLQHVDPEFANTRKVLSPFHVPSQFDVSACVGLLGQDLFTIEVKSDSKSDDRFKNFRLSEVNRLLLSCLEKINIKRGRLYILIDEIDPRNGSQLQKEQDFKIIRDLVMTVYELNTKFSEFSLPVKIICSVREEVLRAIDYNSREIRKVDDDVFSLRWHQADLKRAEDHPLLECIKQRIERHMQINGQDLYEGRHSKPVKVWEAYFPVNFTKNLPFLKWLHEITWNRPRDFVRIFDLAQKHLKERRSDGVFEVRDFQSAYKIYSQDSFQEIVDELVLFFDVDGVALLRQKFRALDKHSDKSKRRIDYRLIIDLLKTDLKGKKYESAKFQAFSEEDFVALLYRVGIIGFSTENKEFWYHRGDYDYKNSGLILIHPGLWSALGLYSV